MDNGAVDRLKPLIIGNADATCRRLSVPSNSSVCMLAPSLSLDIKVESRMNEAKQNNIIINDNNMMFNQKSPPLVPVAGTAAVKLKRAAPKEESDAAVSMLSTVNSFVFK